MKTMSLAVALASLALGAPALAASVTFNPADAPVETGSVGQAKYRMSQSNWDQSLDNGTGTNPGTFIQAALGNNTQLSVRSYAFTLEHRAGEGFIFTMQDNVQSPSVTLAWGTFVDPLPAGTILAASLNGITPGASFNAIKVEARADRAGSTMDIREIGFSSPTLTSSGTLNPLFATPMTGQLTNWIVGDMDLSQHDWTVFGRVAGTRDAVASQDELVRMVIAAKNVTVIPTPAAALMGGFGLAGMPLLRRRRTL